jgi:hypothetical protein
VNFELKDEPVLIAPAFFANVLVSHQGAWL